MHLDNILDTACVAVIVAGAAYAADLDENTEHGMVISKANHELVVDSDRDGKGDRVIRFAPAYEACYDYAEVRNMIVYENKNKEGVVTIKPGHNQVKRINGKEVAEIQRWHQAQKHINTKTR